MNNSKENDKQVSKIDLNPSKIIDLTPLSREQANELQNKYASGIIEIHKKGMEMQRDIDGVGALLSTLNEQTAKATENGSSITIQKTFQDSMGKTELVIGNTDKAANGTFSRPNSNSDNWVKITIIVAIVLVLITIINK